MFFLISKPKSKSFSRIVHKNLSQMVLQQKLLQKTLANTFYMKFFISFTELTKITIKSVTIYGKFEEKSNKKINK